MELFKRATWIGGNMGGNWKTEKATLSDLKAALAEHGLVAVPAVPSEMMMESGKDAHFFAETEAEERFDRLGFGLRANRARHVYNAMIKAAQA